MPTPPSRIALWCTAAVLALAGVGCSSGDSTSTTSAPAGATTTVAGADDPDLAPLTIVVTNDDGIGAPGIDELARQLAELPGVTVKVVAPATEQSGKGDTTTDGDVAHGPGATTSGIEGVAVEGTPADAVNVALGDLGIDADLVAAGINKGQNAGPFVDVSGTVGAARTAVRRGVPAIAGSAGLTEPDYELGARHVVAWVREHRGRLAWGDASIEHVVNINVPQCTTGAPHGIVDVPPAAEVPEGTDPFNADCAAVPTTYRPGNDIDALAHGFAARTKVPAG